MDGHFTCVLFTDLVGSTTLYSRLGDEAAETLRRDHFVVPRSPRTAGARSSRPGTD